LAVPNAHPNHNTDENIMAELHLAWSPEHGIESIWPAWRSFIGLTGAWPAQDLGTALLNQFCRGVWLEDPQAWRSLKEPIVFLANHQVAVESILLVMAVSPLLAAMPMHAISKPEHADSWVGGLIDQMFSWPGVQRPELLFFYRSGDASAMLELIKRLKITMTERPCGLLVHVAASRVLSCRDRVRTLSGVFIDLALNLGCPVVPVKFRGGLPIEPLEGFIDFPVGYGALDCLIGRPIAATELAVLRHPQRRTLLMERINTLGGDLVEEMPCPPDPAFKTEMRRLMLRFGVLDPALAVIWAALARLPQPSPEIALALQGIEAGKLEVPATAEGRWVASLVRWLTEGRIPVRVVV
jgi:hypothetical protein